MHKKNLVQVLLATYNGEKYLEEQLASIADQSYPHWEILVSDDGSDDNTLQILRKWKEILKDKLLVLEGGGSGKGASKNFGFLLSKAKAPYAMLCDQDDVWHADKIEKCLALIQNEESTVGSGFPLMVCTDLEVVDEKLNVLTPSFWKDRNDDPAILADYEKLVAQSVVTGNTILLNQAAVMVSFPINTDFFLHDQWISIKVAYFGKILYLDQVTVKYRQHGKNVLGSFVSSNRYLLSKINQLPRYALSWFKLKKELNLDFSLIKVCWFKTKYNTIKLFK